MSLCQPGHQVHHCLFPLDRCHDRSILSTFLSHNPWCPLHLPVAEVHVLEVVLSLETVLEVVLELGVSVSVTGLLECVTCVLEDVPSLLDDITGLHEDILAVLEDVLAVLEDVLVVLEDVRAVLEDVLLVLEEVPGVHEDVRSEVLVDLFRSYHVRIGFITTSRSAYRVLGKGGTR